MLRRVPLSVRIAPLPLMLSLLFCAAPAGVPPTAIILISIDTLRADYLNLYGYREFETSPFLDSFAADNVVFDNAIVVEPRTLTSHMSLMTGLYPQRYGVHGDAVLPRGVPTLASELSAQGYRTVGFADGAYLHPLWGIGRDFGEYNGKEQRGFAKILPEAIEWLRLHGDDKFFMFLHTYDVHSKSMTFPFYHSRPPYRGTFSKALDTPGPRGRGSVDKRSAMSDEEIRFVRARYAEGIRYVDGQLELFFDFLKERGIYDEALIVVWSDHGDGLYDHEAWSHTEVYEHTIRSPLIMKIPGAKSGRVSTVVSAVDIMPTILEIAQVSEPTAADGTALDGRSLLAMIAGEIGEGYAYTSHTKKGSRLFSIRSGGHHLFWNGNLDQSFFFDLSQDAGETQNLHAQDSSIEDDLALRLRAWIAEHDRAFELVADLPDSPVSAEVQAQLEALGYVE